MEVALGCCRDSVTGLACGIRGHPSQDFNSEKETVSSVQDCFYLLPPPPVLFLPLLSFFLNTPCLPQGHCSFPTALSPISIKAITELEGLCSERLLLPLFCPVKLNFHLWICWYLSLQWLFLCCVPYLFPGYVNRNLVCVLTAVSWIL